MKKNVFIFIFESMRFSYLNQILKIGLATNS